jgi:hypothetical protein
MTTRKKTAIEVLVFVVAVFIGGMLLSYYSCNGKCNRHCQDMCFKDRYCPYQEEK